MILHETYKLASANVDMDFLVPWIQLLVPQPCYDEFFVKLNFFDGMVLNILLPVPITRSVLQTNGNCLVDCCEAGCHESIHHCCVNPVAFCDCGFHLKLNDSSQ